MDGLGKNYQNSLSPRVSVVMGVYNGEAHLEKTTQSILDQTFTDFEFIIIDDGSTDQTVKILEEYSQRDNRIQIYHQENHGLTKALIRGCSLAKGEFIARQDVGDLSQPHRLDMQLDLLVANPELSFASCQLATVGPGGEILGGPAPVDCGAAIIESLKTSPAVGMIGPHHGSVMFRRAAYEQAGGYRPEFYFAQDLDLWARLNELGGLAFIDEVLYQVRFAPGSITARHRPQQLLLRNLIQKATLLRRRGASEEVLLRQAATVGPIAGGNDKHIDSNAEYFIGSCLHVRGDPAATAYLRRVVAARPLHFKAWVRLLSSHMRNRK
jgi:glycosyltransferase involved in cell wall biosynthesis